MRTSKLEVSFQTEKYECEAYNRRAFIQKEQKNGDTDSIPVYIRGIVLTHKGSGEQVKFPYTVRKQSGSFGDSRDKSRRYNVREAITEVARMAGEDAAHRLVNVATC